MVWGNLEGCTTKQVQHSKAGAVSAKPKVSVISITNVIDSLNSGFLHQVMYVFAYKEALCASCGGGGNETTLSYCLGKCPCMTSPLLLMSLFMDCRDN